MSKSRETKHPETLAHDHTGPSRREFLTVGGLGTVGLVACSGKNGIDGTDGSPGQQGLAGATGVTGPTGASCTNAPNGLNTIPTSWDYEADVVVIGSGGAGMVAALAAQSRGASVIVVEMNYDVGGHGVVSGGMVNLGGGTATQIAAGVTNDSPDKVFDDLVTPASYVPSPTGSGAYTPGLTPGLNWGRYAGPYQDRAFCRVYADNNVAAEKFLTDNGILWSPIVSTSDWPAKSGIARTHTPMWKGSTSSPPGPDAPGGAGGTGYIRPLERTARNKGITFLLNYRVNVIHRDGVFFGSVRGMTAAYTGGVTIPGSSTPLKPYCETDQGAADSFPSTGNIHTTQATVTIKANKGVFVATGGASSNRVLRRVFDSRMAEVHQCAGEPYSYQTGDGILLSQKCGASLDAPGNMTSGEDQGSGRSQITKPGSIGCQYGHANLRWTADSPVFGLARASGLAGVNYSNLIHVNMVGQRFVDETATGYVWIDAAMQPNAGSIPPDFGSGPVWAIFDENARVRQSWMVGPPWPSTGPTVDPEFFFSGATISELVGKINTHVYQDSPMTAAALQATISRYNGFVDAKVDTDFGKPAASLLYKIDTGPFYAAFASPVIHDWLTGVRIDAGAHVLDLDGKVIPGLYAAGEDVGGMVMHGLAKCAVFGMIGGHNAGLGV